MSEPINDGGPAFPLPVDMQPTDLFRGMSLRDYFAAKALPVIIAAQVEFAKCPGMKTNSDAQSAIQAYGFADHMLAARKEKA